MISVNKNRKKSYWSIMTQEFSRKTMNNMDNALLVL
jgi:hypothetical protein